MLFYVFYPLLHICDLWCTEVVDSLQERRAEMVRQNKERHCTQNNEQQTASSG